MIAVVFVVGVVNGLSYGNAMYWLKQNDNSKFLLSAGSMTMNAGRLSASGLGSLLEILLK